MPVAHRNKIKIGTFAPSLSKVADAMTRYVSELPSAKNILEVGAGTGAITKHLVKKIGNYQTADVVEIIPQFASLLRKRFDKNGLLTIHCCDILGFLPKTKYDLIICSLPFNAFAPNKTRVVIDRLVDLADDGAILTFIELKFLAIFAPLVLSKKKLTEYYGCRTLIDNFKDRFKFDETVVYLNIPPAVVHYLRIDK